MNAVIMAGGSGTRLWPLSRAHYPKQFLSLFSEETMIQATLSRLKGLPISKTMVITNENHRFIVAEQLRENVANLDIILEPIGRNTAPAIAIAALLSIKNGENPILLILPSDHIIKNSKAFQMAVIQANSLAEQDKLVTFGITPSTAETGYGYIKRGEALKGGAGYKISQFVEKPDLNTAIEYLDTGEFYWNSGMFVFKASRFLHELKIHRPDILSVCEKATAHISRDLDFVRLDSEIFKTCPAESIDYAVMEKTSDGVIVPIDVDWNDVGSWSSLWDVNIKDENNNVLSGDVITHDTRNSLIHASNKLVSTIGLDDIIVVETKDSVLVAAKDKVQDIKILVNKLKSDNRNEYELHRVVHRPWGHYDSIDIGERDQVKRITVKPGAKLSVQMHYHRAEHWVVVSGTAKVTNGDKTFLLHENQSTYIPIETVHALENPGTKPLEIIEVQSGDYLGEDDIVRFEDKYGRK